MAVIGTERPEKGTGTNRVRAGFVRFLALGGDDMAPVHEHGVSLHGAWVTGTLDFRGAAVPHRPQLLRCGISRIDISEAHLDSLDLRGCLLAAGLVGSGVHCAGSVWLSEGFRSTGMVELVDSTIIGSLFCEGGSFESENGSDDRKTRENGLNSALFLDRASISGSAHLRSNFHAIGSVRLTGANVGGDLDCSGGQFEAGTGDALTCDNTTVGGSVSLNDGFHATGHVRLIRATIGGSLDCSGGRFEAGTGDALACDSSTIGGNVFLRAGFKATGQVRMVGARIRGTVECGEARFDNGTRVALAFDGAEISGSVQLNTGFHATGQVRLVSTTIGRTLDCGGGVFVNRGGLALLCDGARIAGSAFLRNQGSGADKGFRAIGGVRLIGATIELDLVCDGGHFSNLGDAALRFEGATIGGAAYLRDGFRAIGEVILRNATIGRGFHCGDGEFKNRKGSALTCDRANISGGMNLNRGFRAFGDVRLPGAQIGSDLNCSEGRFTRGEEIALMCDQVKIAGSVLMNGIEVTGEARLTGATIRGRIECEGGRFDNGTDDALSLEGAEISGPVHLRFGFHATGQVRLVGAKMGDNLDLRGSHFENAGHFENAAGRSLNCYNARIAGGLILLSATLGDGEVSLSLLHARALTDDNSWAGASDRLLLDGFTYERLAAPAFTNANARIAWLDLQPEAALGTEFKPQPWEQAIGALRAAGHVNEARIVAIEKQERLRKAGKIVVGARSFHWIYGLLVGYGYRPLRLLVSIGIVWFVALLAYWAAVNPQWFGSTTYLLAPANREPSASCLIARAVSARRDPCPPVAPNYEEFFAPAYSAEVLLPVISLGYKDDWEPVVSAPDGRPLFWGWALLVLYWFEIVFGWVAGLLVVSFLGGLIKKE